MNWFRKSKVTIEPVPDITTSILYDETTFYNKFINDLSVTKEEVIIESPFITTRRLNILKPIFERLIAKGVQVFVITRPPHEHDGDMAGQAEAGIRYFECIGVQVLLGAGGHHRKLAMIDRTVLWEGSLNILSQSHSREFMRRIESRKLTEELFSFLRFDRFIY
ncbi:MAG TPA: phospholipase D-like domain-containing protein [Patescibacteria group bacterium]|nr:phospholipase D-like domain-containing protein [Patescibacteria group bacterium]